ncbi:MAG: hypothetical protein ACK5LS_05660, partial [Propioniciclava sp.]
MASARSVIASTMACASCLSAVARARSASASIGNRCAVAARISTIRAFSSGVATAVNSDGVERGTTPLSRASAEQVVAAVRALGSPTDLGAVWSGPTSAHAEP